MRLKSMIRAGTAALALAATLDAHAQSPAQLHEARLGRVLYKVIELDTPGVNSRGTSVDDRGWVAGNMVRPDGQYRHAALWRGRDPIDLGTLGGVDANSSVAWDGLNVNGMIVGFSQTNAPEPNGETWSCAFFFGGAMPTGRTCLGVLWHRGQLTRLPPFSGGNNGFATSVNWRGEIVGWAENGVRDPSCTAPQVLRFRAAVWTVERRQTRMRELSPLSEDSASAATSINDRGDVVGISGACDQAVGRFSARHAVLWPRHGPARAIPTFGGISWNTPTAINDRGEVAGFANIPGAADATGETDERAFYWDGAGAVVNIGVLPGDLTSEAYGINNRGTVVGYSAGDNGLRAFIWRKGWLVDLNTLVVPGYPGTLIDARDITDAGVITGAAFNAAGKRVAYRAIPVGWDND